MIQVLPGSQFLRQIELLQDNQKLYLYRAGKDYYALFHNKKPQRQEGKTYRPLTYRAIVFLFIAFKAEISTERRHLDLVLAALERMRDRRATKKKKTRRIARLIRTFCDRWGNWRAGHKWKTTESIAGSLRTSFEAARAALPAAEDPSVPRTPQQPDSQPALPVSTPALGKVCTPKFTPTPPPPLETVPITTTENLQASREANKNNPPQRVMPLPPRSSMQKKKSVVEVYKEDPAGCSRLARQAVFLDVRTIIPTFKRERSFVGLLKEISESDTVVLEGGCAKAVQDMFFYGTKEAQNQLTLWLKEQPSASLSLIENSLQTLIQKHEEQPVSTFAVIQLVKMFKDKIRKQLSQIPPAIDDAMRLLLEDDPNNNDVCMLAEWLSKQPGFSKEMLTGWMDVFERKEKLHHKKLYYPARELLKKSHPVSSGCP